MTKMDREKRRKKNVLNNGERVKSECQRPCQHAKGLIEPCELRRRGIMMLIIRMIESIIDDFEFEENEFVRRRLNSRRI